MSPAVDPALDDALRRFAGRAGVLVALDFDGVLAPIVDEPSAARPLPAASRALDLLSSLDGVTVALVSGRHLDDLRALASPPPAAVLVASHGAQVDGAPPPEVPRDVLARVTSVLERVASSHPGTSVEHKPAAAVLHTRRADPEVGRRAAEAAVAALAEIDGAHVLLGKEVVDVSVVRADKGTALLALAERLGVDAVLYAGDDVTDEHAFTALASRGGPDDVTVKVGDGDTAASHRVTSPADVASLLARLAALRSL